MGAADAGDWIIQEAWPLLTWRSYLAISLAVLLALFTAGENAVTGLLYEGRSRPVAW